MLAGGTAPERLTLFSFNSEICTTQNCELQIINGYVSIKSQEEYIGFLQHESMNDFCDSNYKTIKQ